MHTKSHMLVQGTKYVLKKRDYDPVWAFDYWIYRVKVYGVVRIFFADS